MRYGYDFGWRGRASPRDDWNFGNWYGRSGLRSGSRERYASDYGREFAGGHGRGYGRDYGQDGGGWGMTRLHNDMMSGRARDYGRDFDHAINPRTRGSGHPSYDRIYRGAPRRGGAWW